MIKSQITVQKKPHDTHYTSLSTQYSSTFLGPTLHSLLHHIFGQNKVVSCYCVELILNSHIARANVIRTSNIMHKVDIPLDTKEAACIARRRRAEEQRKLRIFNPKLRTIGKDLDALQKQIEEKRAREQQEKQLNESYHQEACRQALVALGIDKRLKNDQKKVIEDLQNYRQECQRFEDRKEFDLNDPNYVQNSYPARLHDEDPRCGPASLQRFEGEDLSFKERCNAQAVQRRVWLDYQIKEKQQAEYQQKKADEIYSQRIQTMDLRSCQLWCAQQQAKKAIYEATCNYNLALAHEMDERKNLEKRAEEEANMAHQLNMMQSELLTETTNCTSIDGPHKTDRTRFKGFTEDRLAVVREEQRRQILDARRRQQEEAQFDSDWEKQKKREGIAQLIIAEEMRNRQRDVRAQADYTNMQLAREQRLRQEYLNRILYTNAPTEDYYAQFNTTTR